MYFEPMKKTELPNFYKRTKNQKIVEDFVASGAEAAVLKDWEYASAKTGTNSINETIKHYKIGGVHAYARKNQIYLVRTDA